MIRSISISDYFQQYSHSLLLDVRSPGEYEHAHIPGARSLPLFTNDERKVVGTAYKQESREKAIESFPQLVTFKTKEFQSRLVFWMNVGKA